MLQIRVAPSRALTRRREPPSAKLLPFVNRRSYAAGRKKISLAATTKNLTRLAAIKQVWKAFRGAVTSAEVKACKNDIERRNLLWSKKTQIESTLPTKSFESVYGISRRLWEKGILFDLPKGKEFKDILFANQGTMLSQMEAPPPLWILTEIKEMQQRDVEKEKEFEKDLINPLKAKDETEIVQITEAAKIVKEKPSTSSTQPEGKSEQPDSESAKENQLLRDEADADDGLFQYPTIVARKEFSESKNSPDSSDDSKSSKSPKSTESSEGLEDSDISDILDKGPAPEADRETKEDLFEIPASIKKQVEEIYLLEDIAARIMKQLTIDEPPEVVKKMEELKELSKVLREEDMRPDMKPVSYPSQASYAVLSEATALLEEAAFSYVARTMPLVVTWPSFDSPEAQEYKKWISLINRLSRHLHKSGKTKHTLPPRFVELSTYGDVIRNAAAHRIQINAPKMNQLLAHAKQWVDVLEVPETAAKFERLQERAAKMQTEMEEALKPVSEEVMASLDRIRRRWGTVQKFEQQILDIQSKIAREKSEILNEEDCIKDTLKKGQTIRVSQGKLFSRDEMRKYVHVAPVPVQEIPEPPPEPTPAADDTVKPSTEQTIDAVKLPKAAQEVVQEVVQDAPPPRISFGKPKKKTLVELSQTEIKEMLVIESESFTGADQKHLSRDRAGGLVSFSKDTLATIPETESDETPAVASVKREPELLKKEPESKPASETEKPQSSPEVSNLPKEDDVDAPKKSGSMWYNPLSWFK
ncbi:hypothetical protein TWF696_008689 [Orbilia brochopaga]|uniref:Uncharacterized protein n=1 Tax=Orbilia brochopaga TaxID=3140254 RepID=A0AAV9UGR2_9PEZI